MDTTARVLLTVGGAFQIVGVGMTARYLYLVRRRFTARSERLRRRRAESELRNGLIAAGLGLLVGVLESARHETKVFKELMTKVWRVYLIGTAVRLLRRSNRRSGTVVPLSAAIRSSSGVSANLTVRRPAPRYIEGTEVGTQLDALADFADELSRRLDKRDDALHEEVVAERAARSGAMAEVDRDLDELAAGGLRLGFYGVAFIVIGTALGLVAAWM